MTLVILKSSTSNNLIAIIFRIPRLRGRNLFCKHLSDVHVFAHSLNCGEAEPRKTKSKAVPPLKPETAKKPKEEDIHYFSP